MVLAVDFASFWAIVTGGLAFASVFALVILPLFGDKGREEEDEARAYFDEHGHWPDEA